MPPALYPVVSLNEALDIARTIANNNAGQPMYRADIFAALKRATDSEQSRRLITSSSQFGLTSGSYRSATIALDDNGRRIAIDGDPRALVDAVLQVPIFKRFFEQYRDAAVPASAPAKSFLAQNGIPPNRTDSCLSSLLQSGRDAGLIQTIGTSERIVSVERALQSVPIADTVGSAKTTDSVDIPVVPTSDMGDVARALQVPAPHRSPSIHFNIELHLPGDATAETYEAIFSSLRKHLIDVGE